MSKPMEKDMGRPGDDHLVEQAKQGDVEAFAELARRFQQRIHHAILALTGNLQDADDLAQETFMHAYKTLKGFKQQASFFTWLYRIAINLTLNFLKREKKERMKETLNESLPLKLDSVTLVDSPEQDSLKKELSEKLKEAVDSLPIPYRASFVLVAFQGMTHGEAAQILRCSENTVSWRMHKARKMLQTKLKPYLREK
jgi:RNA polymerase sigma-70 factor (ECF subfamily)